jgi:hypothetical protein
MVSRPHPREIGISCWPWGNRRACDAQFNIVLKRGERRLAANKRLHRQAGRAGWCIGHADGQGYYVCPDHKDCVWGATRLNAGEAA